MAFIHGEQVLFTMLLAGVAVFAGAAILFYAWLWYTRLPALYLALAYLMAAALCGLLAVRAEYSVLSVISSASIYILTLPWSVVGHWGLRNLKSSDSELAAVMLCGAGANALILYCVGVVLRRSIK